MQNPEIIQSGDRVRTNTARKGTVLHLEPKPDGNTMVYVTLDTEPNPDGTPFRITDLELLTDE